MRQDNSGVVNFGDLAIPQRLLTAQNEGKLVVFAGAGVSIPSGLPNYNELCSNIEDCFREKRRKHEQYEDFFERLCDKHGLEVRQQVCLELQKNNSNYNHLHRDIIRLFSANKQVRIVTTNFDRLFTIAAKETRQAPVQDSYYSGLPVGMEFKGIVYLHGCLNRDLEDLVLTTRDFTNAYMAAGRAGIFLDEVCRENSVLFLGYGLGDYLVRRFIGLLQDKYPQLYSVIPEDDVAEWQRASIETVKYPVQQGKSKHSKLAEGLHEWAKYSEMNKEDQTQYLLSQNVELDRISIDNSYVEEEKKIRVVASSDPSRDERDDQISVVTSYVEEEKKIGVVVSSYPLRDERDEKYIIEILRDLPTTRFFVSNAVDPKWMDWLDEREISKSLFDPECKLSETESLLTDWICTRFVCSAPETVFGLVHKHGQQLNPEFWRRIVWQVTRAEERPEPKVLAKWVAILLRDVPTDAYRYHSIDYLLTKCRYPEDKGVAIQLLEYLLSPVIETEPSFYISEKMKAEENEIDLRLRLRGDSYWLDECWQGLFKPKLDELWPTLAPIVQLHLTLAYTINESIGHAAGDHDRESWSRSAIEPHEQDKHRRSLDALLDAARDVLECALANDPSAGDCLIAAWFSSGVPLLKRIAIHGVSIASHWMPDEKINWLLEKDLIYHHPYKHEVFQVIAKAFKDTSGVVQHRLVERAEKGANSNG